VREAIAMTRDHVLLEARLVDDLLDITRIAHGKMEISKTPLDLHETIKKAIDVARPDLDSRVQILHVKLEAAEHNLEGDAMRLKQVVWNLLKNASKFSPAGGDIRLATRNDKGRVIIEISDNGIGIEAEALTRIFQSFEQANSAITREFGGLGLGLSIAKASVEAHGGELKAFSAGKGKGATFVVTLPLISGNETRIDDPRSARNPTSLAGTIAGP
jgi:two-component system CheB/CheR fusion protein